MRTDLVIFYGAATSTVIAGILHLLTATNAFHLNEMNFGILFIIAGIAQLFYAVPIVRRWGRSWYYAGIIGTALLIILWIGTRIPSGRVLGGYTDLLPINSVGIAVLVFQFAALLLSIRIIQTATTPSSAAKSGPGSEHGQSSAA
jgi:uncharacterized membrane protein HdeD (DUF308 family)